MHRRRSYGSVAALAAGALVVTTASCAAVFGFDRLQDAVDAGGIADAGVDASSDAGSEPIDLCSGELPPRPRVDGGTPLADLTFALDRIDVSPGGGLNLDGRCTSIPTESSCTLPVRQGIFETQAWVDGPAGADVGANRLLAAVGFAIPALVQENVQGALAYGYVNLLVRLQGWDGTPDDELVFVELYASRGLQGQGDAIERRAPEPADPEEKWTYVESVLGSGYVKNNRVVAQFLPRVPFVLPTQRVRTDRLPQPGESTAAAADAGFDDDQRPLTLRFGDAHLLFDLVAQDAGAYRLENGVLAGRLALDDFFGEASRVSNVDDSPRAFCIDGQDTSDLIYVGLCDARDIVGAPSQRAPGDAPAACDAVSASIGFAARPARVGAKVPPPLDDDPCPGFPSEVACESPPPRVLQP